MASFVRVFELERITFIYGPIECILRPCFVRVLKLEGTTFIYWPIECTLKKLFAKVQVPKIAYIY
jgi:hypothetical protein